MRLLENPLLLIILLVVALIIFGPKRLPELGEGLGKAIREFRKSASDMGDSLKAEVTKPPESTGGTTYAANPPAAPVDPPHQAPPPSETPRA